MHQAMEVICMQVAIFDNGIIIFKYASLHTNYFRRWMSRVVQSKLKKTTNKKGKPINEKQQLGICLWTKIKIIIINEQRTINNAFK